MQPEIFGQLQFTTTDDAEIHISGLTEFWNNQSAQGQIALHIKGKYADKSIDTMCQIPFRNRRIMEYAVEFIAYKLNELICEATT